MLNFRLILWFVSVFWTAILTTGCKKGDAEPPSENETEIVTVSTFAGNGLEAVVDGVGAKASFQYPWRMAIDGAGNLFVNDGNSFAGNIRKITPSGIVTTIFTDPLLNDYNLIAAPNGDIYLYTQFGRIFKLDDFGYKTEIVYNHFIEGIEAFLFINSLEIDASGNMFLMAQGNIFKLDKPGKLSLFYKREKSGLGAPGTYDTTIDSHGNIYIVETAYIPETYQNICRIRKVSTNAVSTIVDVKVPNGLEDLFFISRIAIDSQSNFYFTVAGALTNNGAPILPRVNHIYRMSKSGTVMRIAGQDAYTPLINGPGSLSTFNHPSAISIDKFDNVYVADTQNHLIRKIEIRK